MKPFQEDFLSDVEGRPRAAVKRLTRTIQTQLVQATINAPDWYTPPVRPFWRVLILSLGTLYTPPEWREICSGRTRRMCLWTNSSPSLRGKSLPSWLSLTLPYTPHSLVDIFSTPDLTQNFQVVRKRLLEYYSLLQSSHLTNAVLSTLPVPRTLDPRTPAPLPSRLFTLALLIRDTLSLLVRLPFFLVPLMIHFPAYFLARFGARLVEDEEETQAQNKVVFALLFLSVTYPLVFFGLWALSSYNLIGAPIALAFVYFIAVYHTKLVNGEWTSFRMVIIDPENFPSRRHLRTVSSPAIPITNTILILLPQREARHRSMARAGRRLVTQALGSIHGHPHSIHHS